MRNLTNLSILMLFSIGAFAQSELPVRTIVTSFGVATVPSDARQHGMGSLGVVSSDASISTAFFQTLLC